MFREKRGFLDTIIPFCLNQPCAKLSTQNYPITTQKMSEMELKILEVSREIAAYLVIKLPRLLEISLLTA